MSGIIRHKGIVLTISKVISSPRRRRGAENSSSSLLPFSSFPLLHVSISPLFLFLVLLLFTPTITFPQTADDILSKFFAVQQDDEVLLRWTIIAGNTCEDTYVERSLDGIQYERIGLISGVCGSPDQSVTYDFYDTMPAPNRINHYRLELGLYGYTQPQSTEFIVLNDLGYSIQPNPMSQMTTIIFRNPAEEEFRFLLFDMNGKSVMDFITYEDRITLYREEFNSGVYVFKLESEATKIRGKIVVN
jgi:hypothetical protein